MKTILVATDYSPAADNAVDYAARVARAANATLILFNVFKLSVHASNSMASTGSINQLFGKSEERLADASIEVAARYGITAKWHLGKDNTIDSLKEYAHHNQVDLVVMGIESNLIEYRWFGNTTTEAIGLMQFPLLVVPNDIQFNGIKHITYACEASYLKDGCELGTLKQFLNVFNAKLDVFHVITEGRGGGNEEMEQLMDRILHDVPHSYRYVHSPKVDEGIEIGLNQTPTDLLVMIPDKLGFFESLVKGSNTNQMTVKTRVPMLVIPNEVAC